MKKEETEEPWDKKKVIIALSLFLVLVVFGYFGAKRYLGFNEKPAEVKGESVETVRPKINVRRDVQVKIDDIKEEVNSLDVTEVASSSPQIQKVLNDIKNIQNLPTNQAREACMKICSGI